MKTAAFIGCGNMGGAFIRAAAASAGAENIVVADYEPEKALALARETGCAAAGSNAEAAEAAKFVILCVKPQVFEQVLRGLVPVLDAAAARGERKVLVSIAAGVSIAKIRAITGSAAQPVIRVMPNTPALIGEGLMILTGDGSADEAEMSALGELARGCGEVTRLPEELFDQATVTMSCSPAYAYMFIEALADAGRRLGLDWETALRYAAVAVRGSAEMVLRAGKSPEELCRMVCSPGGSTIEGVKVLRGNGFGRLLDEAAEASYRRNVELGKL